MTDLSTPLKLHPWEDGGPYTCGGYKIRKALDGSAPVQIWTALGFGVVFKPGQISKRGTVVESIEEADVDRVVVESGWEI